MIQLPPSPSLPLPRWVYLYDRIDHLEQHVAILIRPILKPLVCFVIHYPILGVALGTVSYIRESAVGILQVPLAASLPPVASTWEWAVEFMQVLLACFFSSSLRSRSILAPAGGIHMGMGSRYRWPASSRARCGAVASSRPPVASTRESAVEFLQVPLACFFSCSPRRCCILAAAGSIHPGFVGSMLHTILDSTVGSIPVIRVQKCRYHDIGWRIGGPVTQVFVHSGSSIISRKMRRYSQAVVGDDPLILAIALGAR